MPLTAKISRVEIIDAAFKVLRQHGWSKFSARMVAGELKCSTMPIYSQFKSMTELEEKVVDKAMALLWQYQSQSHTGTLSLDRAIGYVLFAWEEPNLFAAIYDKKHVGMVLKDGHNQFETHVEELSRSPLMKDLSKDQLRSVQLKAWLFVHGIASMKNWMDVTQTYFTKESMIDLIRESMRSLMHGFVFVQSKAGLATDGDGKSPKKVLHLRRRATGKNGQESGRKAQTHRKTVSIR